MQLETITNTSGATLTHRGGWMTETDVARAIGVAQPKHVRGLPIPRTSVKRPGSRYARNRYRVEHVEAYIEANTSTPATA